MADSRIWVLRNHRDLGRGRYGLCPYELARQIVAAYVAWELKGGLVEIKAISREGRVVTGRAWSLAAALIT